MRALRFAALGVVLGCASPAAKPEPVAAPLQPAASPNPSPPAPEKPPDAPYVPTTPAAPAQVPGPTPEDEKECKARGGKVQPVCMLGNFECVIRYRDGGKRCTDKRDCTGECFYEGPRPVPAQATGACQRTNDPCGCHARVIGGTVQPTMCVD